MGVAEPSMLVAAAYAGFMEDGGVGGFGKNYHSYPIKLLSWQLLFKVLKTEALTGRKILIPVLYILALVRICRPVGA